MFANLSYSVLTAVAVSFFGTLFLLKYAIKPLPKDMGRENAVEGALSAGKTRGVGLLYVTLFALLTIVFVTNKAEYMIYLVLLYIEMLTGYLDDRSRKPWNDLKKAILDLTISISVVITYIYFNGTEVKLLFLDKSVIFPIPVFAVLAVVLIWGSINVTNCADGVDGLSASLSIISLLSFALLNVLNGENDEINKMLYIFIAALVAYLWYNSTPCTLLMGDAGSRAEGMLIGLAALTCMDPFLYIVLSGVLLADGGLGILKVFLARYFKIRIFKNTRMPLHDHVRKKKNWSNTQTVARFAIIQSVISFALLYFVKICK